MARRNGNCVKCDGTGLTSFIHIAQGACFDCGGTGSVPAGSKYAAKHYRPGPPPPPSKTVTLAGFGLGTIRRDKTGGFSLDLHGTDDRGGGGGGRAFFNIRGGKVKVDRSILSDGLKRRGNALERQLQLRFKKKR